jgi:hypothetical protein
MRPKIIDLLSLSSGRAQAAGLGKDNFIEGFLFPFLSGRADPSKPEVHPHVGSLDVPDGGPDSKLAQPGLRRDASEELTRQPDGGRFQGRGISKVSASRGAYLRA